MRLAYYTIAALFFVLLSPILLWEWLRERRHQRKQRRETARRSRL